ncbi:MAG: RecX family transcriptional regulator [Firmicutes bacterium]|nr:RecX family transcriptional regulator [[Eubacterium] siraeum]MCM1487272.1 RecX family transcriptional regulator [Bacillota bacterium]
MGFLEEEQAEGQRKAEYERARKRAMYLLGAQDYSAAALREKLLNNYSEETADRVIADMKRYGFLDDEKYARKLAAYLIKTKKYGLYQAKAKMRQKGVEASLIEEALGEYGKEDYVRQLVELIQKKYGEKIADPEDRRRTAAALVRRGYGFSEVKEAMNTVLSGTSEKFDGDYDYYEE